MNLLSMVDQGFQLRERRDALDNRNALTTALQTSGPRSPQAYNALAAADPGAAMQIGQPDPRAMAAQRQAAAGLVKGVLGAPEEVRPQLYAQALRQAQQMGMDIAGVPEQYPGDQALQVMGAVLGMEDTERTEFERLLETVPEDQRGQAILQRLGLAQPETAADAVVVGGNLVNRRTGEVLFTAPQGQSALAEKVQMLMASGLDRERAIGIATGRIREGQDEYGRTVPTDLGAPPPGPIGSPGMASPDPARPDFDPSDAFGAGSTAGRALNVITDFFGLGLAAPESERAASGIRAFNEGIKRTITQAYSGRPSNYLMQRIETLLPDTDAILTGDARALDRYRALDTELASEEQIAVQRLQAPLQGNARVEAELTLNGIRHTRSRIQGVIAGFGGAGAAEELPPTLQEKGWTPEQWRSMTPEQRQRATEIVRRLGGSGAANPSEAPVPGPAERVIKGSLDTGAPVAPIQLARGFVGGDETRHAEALSAFFRRMTGDRIDPRETAWCAAFANAVLQASGETGTGKLNARSFLEWGEAVERPNEGDIVVLWRENPSSWKGHVGFFAGYDDAGGVRVVGGNQDNSISEKTYSADRVLGFRRPPKLRDAA